MGFGFQRPETDRDRTYPSMTVTQVKTIRELGLTALQQRGHRAAVSADGGSLHSATGGVFGLDNLVASCRNAPTRDWPAIVDKHFADVIGARSEPRVDDFDRDELASRVRARVLSVEQVCSAGAILEYAWPVADGLAEVVCVDYPDVVNYLDSARVRALGADWLRETGRANTAAEPVDGVHTLAYGDSRCQVLHGASAFVASKVLVLETLAPQYLSDPNAPTVIGVPARNFLAVYQPTTLEALLEVLNSVAIRIQGLCEGNPGPVSGDLYLRHRGGLHRITSADPSTKKISVDATGPLGELVSALTNY